MSIGAEIAFRRSARGRDATGSLLFDAERKRAQRKAAENKKAAPNRKPGKRAN
jgi:hypothetical protein